MNKTQSGVPGGLVDSFLLALSDANKEFGARALDGIPKQIREDLEFKVRAIRIAILMSLAGPWKGLIQRPNERLREPTIGQKAISDEIYKIVKLKAYRDVELPKMYFRLNQYWIAIRRFYPKAKSEPKKYWVQKRLGMVVFMRLFPLVDTKASGTRDSDQYYNILDDEATIPEEEYWSYEGEARTLGTSYSAISDVSKEIWPNIE